MALSPLLSYAQDFPVALRHCLESELLWTLEGIKPVTEVHYENNLGYDLPAVMRGLRQAKREGRIKNKNIGWFEDGPGVYFYNRRAIAQLRDNPEQMKLLEPYGFSKRDTVNQTIAKLRGFYGERVIPYDERTPEQIYRHQVVGGVFFGYSPREVEAFARVNAVRQQRAWRAEGKPIPGRTFFARGLPIPRVGQPMKTIGTRIVFHGRLSDGAFMDITGRSGDFIIAARFRAGAALQRYVVLRARGWSGWRIFNRYETARPPSSAFGRSGSWYREIARFPDLLTNMPAMRYIANLLIRAELPMRPRI